MLFQPRSVAQYSNPTSISIASALADFLLIQFLFSIHTATFDSLHPILFFFFNIILFNTANMRSFIPVLALVAAATATNMGAMDEAQTCAVCLAISLPL
jgi:hypothetical protein